MISRQEEPDLKPRSASKNLDEAHLITSDSTEAASNSSQSKIEIDPHFPEAEFISKQLLATLEDEDSFIHTKDKTALTEHRTQDDDALWGIEIAAQLQTQKKMRIGGLLKEEHDKRSAYVIEALKNHQPIELDLGILWVGSVDAGKLTIVDLAIVNNIVGLMKILGDYQDLDTSITANLRLKIAVEPSLRPPITDESLQPYIDQLILLAETQATSKEINLDKIKLHLTTESGSAQNEAQPPNQELNPAELAATISEYWQESEQIYQEELQRAREMYDNEDLTWDELSRSVLDGLMPVNAGETKNIQYQLYLNKLGRDKLSKLPSFQKLPKEIQIIIGWLSPNFKHELLQQTAEFSGLADSNFEANLLENPNLIALSTESLAIKLIALAKNENLATALVYQFGADIADSPVRNTINLRHLGNLSHNRQSPWLKTFMIHRNSKDVPKPESKSNISTPNKHGLRLETIKINSEANMPTATVTVGEQKIEIPIRYTSDKPIKASVVNAFKGSDA